MTNTLPILSLQGAIQHYDWGGYHYIPQLLQLPHSPQQPHAELWMGTHNRGPASILNTSQTLDKWMQENPLALGQENFEAYGPQLPYLFKVLDVRQMLSIQAHPTKQQAEQGFRHENEIGIPLTAFHRNYKDDNHKPELMVALTDFWLLHGFKSASAINAMLQQQPEFAQQLPAVKNGNIKALYQYIMELPQTEVDQLLSPLKKRLEGGQYTKDQAHYWAQRAFQEFRLDGGHYDRGIFSIYLFNIVHLQPGQGIYQAAGIPHAYLEGVNMEIMANSDNVFRGGLTKKHVDVPELLKSLIFESITPKVLDGARLDAIATHYPTPAKEFGLAKLQFPAQHTYTSTATSPEILIVLEGRLRLEEQQLLSKGSIIFIPKGASYTLQAKDKSVAYKAFVPN
ncbi:MAG: mannose-6-phosphate isomerase, class I [Bacteroidota bacterium]